MYMKPCLSKFKTVREVHRTTHVTTCIKNELLGVKIYICLCELCRAFTAYSGTEREQNNDTDVRPVLVMCP